MPLIQESSNFNISGNAVLNEIHGNATIIRFGDGSFTEIQRNTICDNITNLTVLPDTHDKSEKNNLIQPIMNLPRTQAALSDYEIQKRCGLCFEGTREALLREMEEWIADPSDPRIYVLSGLAGIGKSTIAYTVASRADGLGLLGASFFFSRDSADRRNAKKFFTTLAFQLCVFDEEFAFAIGNTLLTVHGYAATTQGPQEQLQALILEPLRGVVESRARPVVIVVDALDECDDNDASSVYLGLKQLVQILPLFKVVLTTRPQPVLNNLFSILDGLKVFYLQDIEDEIVDSDIRLYLKHSMSQKQVQACFGNPMEQWHATDVEIDSLVQAAGRLFIIASTAVLYILDKFAADPASRMAKLLYSFAQDRTPFNSLNLFYTIILRHVVPTNCDDDDIVERYQTVVGTIVLIRLPLPVKTISRLIGRKDEEVLAVLRNLQPVILLGSDDIPRIYHRSFSDYIMDPTRCKDDDLLIRKTSHHTNLAIRCFKLMNEHLKQNFLGIGDPTRFMNVEKVEQEVHGKIQSIPLEIGYACAFWAYHLKDANIEDISLLKGLEKFISEHMLHCFEILSWMKGLSVAHEALGVVLNRLVNPAFSELGQLVSDGLRFLSKFYEVIERSPLHIYYSALPFTPTESLLYRRYSHEITHNLCQVQGGRGKWDAVFTVQNHLEGVDHVAFSLDDRKFISWSIKCDENRSTPRKEGLLRFWDAFTGTPTKAIFDDMFAVTADLTSVASAKDCNVTIRDPRDNISSTFTTPAKILRLALSFEGSRVATGLSDGTVLLWDREKKDLMASLGDFKCDEDNPGLLAFSPSGTRLAYTSVNGALKLQDGNGAFIADLRNMLSEAHDKVVFSRDDSLIASLCDGRSGFAAWKGGRNLTLWSGKNGKSKGSVLDNACSLAISPDGSLLATGHPRMLKLWTTSDLFQLPSVRFLEQLDVISTLAFCPEGNVLAIGVWGSNVVKLYDIRSRTFFSSFPFPFPKALSFSHARTWLVAGSANGSLHLWDVQGMEKSGYPIENKAKCITSLALSKDCLRLVCGYDDGRVELRETDIMQRTIAATKGHTKRVTALGFSPDGKNFASMSDDGAIKLWSGERGVLIRSFKHPTSRHSILALSNHILAATTDTDISLWDLRTLGYLDIVKDMIGMVLGVAMRSATSTLGVGQKIDKIEFLADDAELLVHLKNDEFQLFDIINNEVTQAGKLAHLSQLCQISIWHGIPISLEAYGGTMYYIEGRFPEYEGCVPILQIPWDLGVVKTAQGVSMIALGCVDGRVILLRPSIDSIA